jgi:hypothetical protein
MTTTITANKTENENKSKITEELQFFLEMDKEGGDEDDKECFCCGKPYLHR